MKRSDSVFFATLMGLAGFVGYEVASVRWLEPSRRAQVEAFGRTSSETGDARDAGTYAGTNRRRGSRDFGEDVRHRIELASAHTYLGEVLAAHDSSLARWSDRRTDPLRVWIQPFARIKDWSPASLPIVRDAFIEWGDSGLPLNFSFVLDSASANVHVFWVDRFPEQISGKTLWTHDESWQILEAKVLLAVHHRTGELLDESATRAIALHEVGHLIGLDHTRDTTSVMASRVRVKDLSSADRATAQLLYALPSGRIGRNAQ